MGWTDQLKLLWIVVPFLPLIHSDRGMRDRTFTTFFLNMNDGETLNCFICLQKAANEQKLDIRA